MESNCWLSGMTFEAWKRSHIGCSALLCGRFDDSQESRFQASKRSNICSAVLQGGRPADFPKSVLKLQYVHIWTVSNCKGGLFYDSQEWHFQVRNVQIRAAPSSKGTICTCLGKAFSKCENLIMGCAVQQWNWIADSQESRFQAANRTEMCSTVMKELRFFW